MTFRLAIVGSLVIGATSLGAGLAVPAVWRAMDVQLQVTPPEGVAGIWSDQLDPWGRPLRTLEATDEWADLMSDVWDRRPYVSYAWKLIDAGRVDPSFKGPVYLRVYSYGPDGEDQFGFGPGSWLEKEYGPVDDIRLLHPDDPKLRLLNASGRLAGCAVLGMGLLVGLLVGRRALTGRRGQFVATVIGAVGLVTMAEPIQETWSLVSSQAPFTLWQVITTAALGGAVFGLALGRSSPAGHSTEAARGAA